VTANDLESYKKSNQSLVSDFTDLVKELLKSSQSTALLSFGKELPKMVHDKRYRGVNKQFR